MGRFVVSPTTFTVTVIAQALASTLGFKHKKILLIDMLRLIEANKQQNIKVYEKLEQIEKMKRELI